MLTARAMTLRELLATNPEYDPETESSIWDFYEGGKRFERAKVKYLLPRASDANDAWKKARFNSSYYPSPLSGKVDGLIGGILRAPPTITVNDSSDPRAEFWRNLNFNADGKGTTLQGVVRNALLQEMLIARATFAIRTTQLAAITGETNEQAKARGRLDCFLISVDASQVDDWDCDEDGYNWIRTHICEPERDGDIGPFTKEVHTWRYYEADAVTVYRKEVTYKDGVCPSLSSLPQDESISADQTKHDFKVNPLVPCELPQGFNLGDRLLPIVKALFQRRSAAQFVLNTGAYTQPVLKTEKPVTQAYLHEMAIIAPGENGSFEFTSPDGAVFEAQAADSDRIAKELDTALAALADQAQSRMSGVTVQQFRDPKEQLMKLFANPVLNALQNAIDAIAAYRKEDDLEPTVTGMNEFDTQSTEVLITATQQYLMLPGITKTRRKIAMQAVDQSFLGDISADDQAAIEEEDEALPDVPSMTPAAQPGDNSIDGMLNQITSAPVGQIRNGKTNAPQGLGADQIRQSSVKR